MNTLVTGGKGLVGSFIPFGLKPTKDILNLLDYQALERYIENNNISSIIHTAAKVGGVHSNTKYVFDFFVDNLNINTNILKVCQKYSINKSLFMISTCAFPKNAQLPLQTESLHNGEPHETNYGYAYAKRMIEVGIRSLKQQYNLMANSIIPCNLYGEYDNYHLENGHVIPGLIHKCYLAKKNNTTLEIWGSGNAEREFIYAKDIADIIDSIHKNNLYIDGPMIVSPDSIITIKEIVHNIVKIMKFNGEVYFNTTKPEGILKKNSSNAKFRTHFPDFQFTALEEGLGKTIEYFLSNYSSVRQQ
jgi:GDP-L-fucose synthase